MNKNKNAKKPVRVKNARVVGKPRTRTKSKLKTRVNPTALTKGNDDLITASTGAWYRFRDAYEYSKSSNDPWIDDVTPCFFNATTKGGFIVVDLNLIPKCMLHSLADCGIPASERKKVMTKLVGHMSDDINVNLNRPCSTLEELAYVASTVYPNNGDAKFNVEVYLNDRWYAAKLTQQYNHSMWGSSLTFSAVLKLSRDGDSVPVRYRLTESAFIDEKGIPTTLSIAQAMTKMKLRPVTTVDQNYTSKCWRAENAANNVGKQIAVTGDAIIPQYEYFGLSLEQLKFGTKHLPRRVIVEPSLELDSNDSRDNGNEASTVLPFVRVFSIELKKYMYVDVDDIVDVKYDDNAFDKLILPNNIKSIVRGLFESHVDDLFGDVLTAKHGGMIICASGAPGVGKTLTAEVFAEHTKRPLYPIELGELGTSLTNMETKLNLIFSRAKRWNAVLLLDEADILFKKRDENLERSAIVGVFLRLLDYYQGFMFLTTNMRDKLDPAFNSRITLSISYPDLTKATRARVWSTVLAAAGVTSPIDVNVLASVKMNGRNIRSMVRLIRAIHGTTPTAAQINELLSTTYGENENIHGDVDTEHAMRFGTQSSLT